MEKLEEMARIQGTINRKPPSRNKPGKKQHLRGASQKQIKQQDFTTISVHQPHRYIKVNQNSTHKGRARKAQSQAHEKLLTSLSVNKIQSYYRVENGTAVPFDLFIKEEDLIQPLAASGIPPASIKGNDGPSTMPMSPKGSELIKTSDFTSAKMQRLIISDQQAL